MATLRGLMPAVGPYSREFTEMGMDVGLGKDPSISSSTSGAPCPRLAHRWGWSMKPCSVACSVHLLFFSILPPEEQRVPIPDNPSAGTIWVEPSVGLVSCVGAKLDVLWG